MGYEFTWTAHTSTVDQTGNIFFPKVFERADDGIQALLETIGYPLHRLITDEGYALPIVHAEADYLAPIAHGDRVACDITPDPGGSSIRFEVAASVDGEPAAEVVIVRVFVDLDAFEKRPLPEGLREGLVRYG